MSSGTSRVAIVTGGGRGIGAEIARRLAGDGHLVAVNYLADRAAAEAVVDHIVSHGGHAVVCGADVSQPGEVEALVLRVRKELGEPTILVNNAGRASMVSARRQPADAWDQTLAVNLSAAYYCTHAVIEAMVAQAWGRVISLSSPVGGRTPMPGQSAYAAAKAGLVAMTRSIALEVAGTGVTVNAVMPGYVETALTRSVGDEGVAFMRRTWPQIPTRAIADTVSFLASDAADHVSGEEIGVWLAGPIHRP